MNEQNATYRRYYVDINILKIKIKAEPISSHPVHQKCCYCNADKNGMDEKKSSGILDRGSWRIFMYFEAHSFPPPRSGNGIFKGFCMNVSPSHPA